MAIGFQDYFVLIFPLFCLHIFLVSFLITKQEKLIRENLFLNLLFRNGQ